MPALKGRGAIGVDGPQMRDQRPAVSITNIEGFFPHERGCGEVCMISKLCGLAAPRERALRFRMRCGVDLCAPRTQLPPVDEQRVNCGVELH